MNRPRIALAARTFAKVSETFIRRQIETCPWDVSKVTGRYLRTLDDQTVAVPAGVSMAEWYRRRRGIRPSDSIAQRDARDRWLADRFAERDVRLVVAHYGVNGVQMMHACRRASVPMVVHFHGYDATSHEVIRRHGDEYRVMFGHAAKIIACSDAMADDLRRLGAPDSKLEVCRYHVAAADRSIDVTRSKHWIAVGRMVDKKSPLSTIEAFARAHRRDPETRLTMIGGGKLLKDARRLVRRLNLDDVVSLPGAMPNDRVRRLMHKACGFLQHSVTAAGGDAEGTPVAALESMAAGLPLIVTRHKGLAEIVEDGRSGFLVDEHDIETMADRIVRLNADTDRRAEFGRRGHELMRTRFSFDATAGRLNDVLRKAAGGSLADTVDDSHYRAA